MSSPLKVHSAAAPCGRATALTVNRVLLSRDPADVTCAWCIGGVLYESKPCGTAAAYRRHLRHGEKPCESCRQANNRYQQDKRVRLGHAIRGDLKPCGTYAAYKRHLWRGEKPCDECGEANNAFQRDYRKRKKQAA